MSFAAKVAMVFVCAVICAAGILLIPRQWEQRKPELNRGTPVFLRKSQPTHWLLV